MSSMLSTSLEIAAESAANSTNAYEINPQATGCQEQIFTFRHELTRPPVAVSEFVERVIRQSKYYQGSEKRAKVRYPAPLRVTATPVDDRLHRKGEPFVAASRDISSTGIAIYHTRDVAERFLALELSTGSGEKMHVVLEVLRHRHVGLFYEIAGRFVTRLSG